MLKDANDTNNANKQTMHTTVIKAILCALEHQSNAYKAYDADAYTSDPTLVFKLTACPGKQTNYNLAVKLLRVERSSQN